MSVICWNVRHKRHNLQYLQSRNKCEVSYNNKEIIIIIIITIIIIVAAWWCSG